MKIVENKVYRTSIFDADYKRFVKKFASLTSEIRQLEEILIKYFMRNAKKAQLLVASHSTNILTNRLLRPDQIYTVEFVAGKGSVINRASKEQPREAQNLEKMYLGGVFGGVPNYQTA